MIRILTIALMSLVWVGASAGSAASEQHAGIRLERPMFQAADGTRLRAIVTKPQSARGRGPAILFVQWLSCDSVEIPTGDKDGWALMLEQVVRRSGALVWRTQKRGIGGSEGECASLDYDTELADHRAALNALRARRDVDPNRIVIFGGSMGGNMAPLLAADEPVAGVLVWGMGTRTWAERMLAFERNRVELGDTPASQRASTMMQRFRFIDAFLIGRRTPQTIAATDPALGAAWSGFAGAEERSLYGRPFAFHWQAQAKDWAGAWARVQAPVLATFGEFDWFEDASGVAIIADIANRDSPGQARFALIGGLDHHFSRFADARAAFADRNGTPDPKPFLDVAMPWLYERLGVRG
jgi:pimeloyl-ACP methyl ester carboxylesterase